MSLIFLIGMPGCGKTYWGEKVAKELNYNFVDTDALIEESEQRSISEIFAKEGEQFFRGLERKTLFDVIFNTNKKTIVACGGGLPAHEDNLDVMKQNGCVVYLQCDLDILAKRIEKDKNRPMLSNKENLTQQLGEIYEARMPYYMVAHNVLVQDEITIDNIKTIVNNV